MRNDVAERKKDLEKRWRYFALERPAAARTWTALDKVGRWYLLMRACDWVMYGKEFADRSFPNPSNSDLSLVVSSLRLFQKHEAECVKKLEDAEEAEERENIERECAESVAKIVVSPRPYLEPRVLSVTQVRAVKRACAKELAASEQVKAVAATIVDFAAFCKLLAEPENHVRIKGQYVEKQARARTEINMVNEAARLLSSIEPHTAYARFEKKEGGTGVWAGKVRMRKLDDVGADALARAHDAIKPAIERYTRPRERIRREIEERQNAWRVEAVSGLQNAPLPPGKRPSVPAVPLGTKLTAPPPTRTTSRLPRGR